MAASNVDAPRRPVRPQEGRLLDGNAAPRVFVLAAGHQRRGDPLGSKVFLARGRGGEDPPAPVQVDDADPRVVEQGGHGRVQSGAGRPSASSGESSRFRPPVRGARLRRARLRRRPRLARGIKRSTTRATRSTPSVPWGKRYRNARARSATAHEVARPVSSRGGSDNGTLRQLTNESVSWAAVCPHAAYVSSN